MTIPTRLDIWFARELAGLLRISPRFDLSIEDAISHNILGGLWFGATLFFFWIRAARESQRVTQLRMLTILVGSGLAIVLMLVAGALISWLPPARYSGLAGVFPGYLEPKPNMNCFPSQSTALYGSIAAGIYSIHKTSGWVLWGLVAVLVSLPRMYVGGHYLTDILAGLLIGVIAYTTSRYLLEAKLISPIDQFLEQSTRLRILREFVLFLWIFQVTVEFRDLVWLKKVVESVIR